MTGGELIYAALATGSPLPTSVGIKVRQDAADEDDGYDFIIYRRVAVERQRGLDGTLLATRETFHIECWAKTRPEAEVIEAEAIAALTAAGYYPDGNDVDGIDPDVKVRAAVFVVDIWS